MQYRNERGNDGGGRGRGHMNWGYDNRNVQNNGGNNRGERQNEYREYRNEGDQGGGSDGRGYKGREDSGRSMMGYDESNNQYGYGGKRRMSERDDMKSDKEIVREKSIWRVEKWYEDRRGMTVVTAVW
jgi:hypothetical protein